MGTASIIGNEARAAASTAKLSMASQPTHPPRRERGRLRHGDLLEPHPRGQARWMGSPWSPEARRGPVAHAVQPRPPAPWPGRGHDHRHRGAHPECQGCPPDPRARCRQKPSGQVLDRTSLGSRQAKQDLGRGCKPNQRGLRGVPREGHGVVHACDAGMRISKHTSQAWHPPQELRVMVPVRPDLVRVQEPPHVREATILVKAAHRNEPTTA